MKTILLSSLTLFIGLAAQAGVDPSHRAIQCAGLTEEMHYEFSVDRDPQYGESLYWLNTDSYSNYSYSQKVLKRSISKNNVGHAILSLEFEDRKAAEKFLINTVTGFSKILFDGEVVQLKCVSSAAEIDDSYEFAKANKLPQIPQGWLEREGFPIE